MQLRLSLSLSIIGLVLVLSTCRAPASTPALSPTEMSMSAPTATPIPGLKQQGRVLRVVDGDTIVVELDGGRYPVRYIGIDTPETHHPTDGADYWGFEATDANVALVGEGTSVILQRDISETDVYGRLLRYVWVEDLLVNAELVRAGWARVLFYEPDVRYKHEILAAEAEARAAQRGLYGPLPTPPADKPLLYKGTAWTAGAQGGAVRLWPDPSRGEPDAALPAGLEVRVADAFWAPETEEWWYWIGVQGFNGWTTGQHISREGPSTAAPGPEAAFAAYDRVTVDAQVEVYALPRVQAETVGLLAPGTSVQLKGVSWEQDGGRWWYYLESTLAEGWVRSEQLGR